MSEQSKIAALRHLVYSDVIDLLPIASCEQVERFVANLKLVTPGGDGASFARRQNAAIMRFVGLHVTPDIREVVVRPGFEIRELENFLNRKWGDRLRFVSGFYRHGDAYRLNLARGCALYAYRVDRLFAGILCQPLRDLNRFWLLTSAKHGGPRATPLSTADRQYFTQYEDAN